MKTKFFVTTRLNEFLNENNADYLLQLVLELNQSPFVSCEDFQVWILERHEETKFSLELQDGNLNKLLQVYFTSESIRLDSLRIWFENSVLFFPEER